MGTEDTHTQMQEIILIKTVLKGLDLKYTEMQWRKCA